MIARGFLVFSICLLANCVLSLPVTQSRFEEDDVKVMKCIVEALADVLSRPRPLPVSQECLDTLRTDERLVSILRHQNFLKELQNIAVQGSNERAQTQGDIIADHVTGTPQTPQSTDDVADRSMLEALGGPGERSILAGKRGAGGREAESTEKDSESQEGNEIRGTGEEERRQKDENPDNRISDSLNEEENVAGMGTEEEEEEERESSEEDSEDKGDEGDSVTEAREDTNSNEKSDAVERSEEKKSAEEEEEEEEEEDAEKKRSALLLRDSAEAQKEGREGEEEKEEVKRERGEDSQRQSWKKELARSSQTSGRAGPAEHQEVRSLAVTGQQEVRSLEVTGQQEVPHHSQEVTREEEERKEEGEERSPEERELQMMAGRAPEERRSGDEEGSASRKTEDPEIESLAAIESELENVAQKLHKLRQG